MKNNILFIGFMGVGKGTIARALSKHKNMFNIDTDDLIESFTNIKIKKIFKLYGESYFRDLEQQCANWIYQTIDNTIIACGGGFFNVKNIDKLGKVIFLDASFEWIYERILHSPNGEKKLLKRPLFYNLNKAKKLYDSRKKNYKDNSHFQLNIENQSIKNLIDKIECYI